MKRALAMLCAVCVLMSMVNVTFAVTDGQEAAVSGNLFVNPGFEESTTATPGWTKANGVTTEVKRSGNNSLLVNIGSAPDKCEQTVYLSPGKTYIWSMWVKSAGADSTMTLWEVGSENLFDHKWVTVTAENPDTEDGWTELRQVFTTPSGWTADQEYKMALLCGTSGTTIYIDDCYLGVLAVNEIQISGQSRVFISASQEKTAQYTASLFNQFGTGEGVENTAVEWSLDGEYEGISIDSETGILTVLPSAAEGTVTVAASADDARAVFEVIVEKESIIPVTDENLFQNGGFEDGESPWSAYSSVSEDTSKNGAKSMYVQIGSAQQKVKQTVNLQKNKIYITSAYFLPEEGFEGKTVQMYAESRCDEPLAKYMNDTTVNAVLDGSDWKQAVRMYSTKDWSTSGNAEFGILAQSTNCYVDEMYLGELVLKEVAVSGNSEVTIPYSSTGRAAYRAELLNQLENGMGLSGETVEWSLDGEYEGVSINSETGMLSVEPTAEEGTVGIVAACVPSFNTQGEVSGSFEVTLTKEPLSVETVKQNMLTNGGFEDGATGWSSLDGASEANAYEGSKSGKIVYGKNAGMKATQVLTIDPNAVYIMYAYLKGDEGNNGTAVQMYAENRSSNPGLTSSSSDSGYNKNATVVENEWTQAVRIYKTDQWTESGEAVFGALSSNGLVCFIDNVYVGRLVIDSFGIRGNDALQIPSGSTVAKAIYTSTPVNQAGTTMGVGAERVTWELAEEYDGVSINSETGELSVTSEAPAGIVKVRAVCYPSFNTDLLTKLYEDKAVKLTSDAGPAPVIRGLKVNGAVEANSVLTASYRFYQKDGNGDASEYQWYRTASEDGEYTKIEGATGASYTVGADEGGYLFAVEVTPKDDQGNVGEPEMSLPAVKPTAPTALNAAVEGKAYVGATVSAKYDFYDVNGDEEGESEFRWYRGEDEDSLEVIPGAVDREYTFTEEDSGMYIAVGITAVSKTEPYKDEEAEVLSECIIGPAAPVAADVSIKGDVAAGETVVAEYTYTHPYGLPEKDTKFRWIMDGNTVGTGASYQIPSGSSGGRLVLEVTAGCKFEPHYGEAVASKAVSVAKQKNSWSSTVSGGSGGSSGGSGGSGWSGGSSSSAGISGSGSNSGSVVQQNTHFSDTTGHWAKNEIDEMADAGVISGTGNGNFEPDRAVSRAEFVTMISRMLGLENDSDGAMFTDVNSGEWYFDTVQAAYSEGIINGYGDVFRPTATITREEAAKVLVSVYEKYIGEAENGEIEFSDEDQISSWALDYVAKAVGCALLKGDDTNLIRPQGNLSRAEAACLLYRIYSALNGGAGK